VRRGADVVDASAVVAWADRGVRVLHEARGALDRVNVFPVADADTGTNMYLTLVDAARALPAAPATGAGAGDLLVRMARGALVGARGNSGVILSEYLRGMAVELAGHREVGPEALAAALGRAARTARGAVARPAPGTILTAADAAARSASAAAPDVAAVVAAARDGARAAALRSAGELEALAQARVLDAGALGLVLVLDALLDALRGTPADSGQGVSEVLGMMSAMVPVPGPADVPGTGPRAVHEGGEFEVMYVVDGSAVAETPPGHGTRQARGLDADPADLLRAELARVGDSVVVVGGSDVTGAEGRGLWQAHVHTDDPGAAVAVGRAALSTFPGNAHGTATLRQVRVRHLPGQHGHPPGPPSADVGFVAVTSAPGLVADLARVGAVVLLREPGSAPDLGALHRAALDTRAAHVVVLPGVDLVGEDVRALRVAVQDDGVDRLDVLPARTDVHVVVALAAVLLVEGDGAGEGVLRLRAARSAVADARVVGAPADAAAVALQDLLADPVEVLTVLADDDVPQDALDALAAVASGAGAEVVELRSGRLGGALTLAAEAHVHHPVEEGRA
jgi:dihydroxyacetone kinase-like predicted kinase